MLVWINGPFGGGKTQTAYELHRRLPGSVVCDPELVGFGLQRMTPPGLRGDFQDLPAWRQGVFEVLQNTLSHHPGVVLAPMTLVEPVYFEEILGRLRAEGHAVHHVALLAEREIVLRRLRERVVGRVLSRSWNPRWVLNTESFAVRNLDRCLERLATPYFAEQVRTDQLTVPQVADRIAATAGLELGLSQGGALRQRLRQIDVGLRHLRLG